MAIIKRQQLFFLASFVILFIAMASTVSAEDKGDTIILGAGGFGGFGGGGFGGGAPNIVSGGKKGDVIIIGPQWGF